MPSLTLQMSLYFNVIFFPIWLASILTILTIKFYCMSTLYQFIAVLLIVAITVIECIRLYLGYLGNLRSKLPELAAFWMLSLLLQFPLQLFLLVNKHLSLQPLEYTVQVVMLSLLTAQLITGFVALRVAAKTQTNHFRLMQFYFSEQKSD